MGRTISQYEVVAKLGGGGMGVVYKALDTKLGRTVALKFLPPQWSHDEGAKQRFLREAQAASATNHRNICIIHDIQQTDDGQLFIVMAHYDGQTLKQRLEGGALPITDAIEIATEVAEGLAKAHAQGVVHRDVKPGNLMVTEDGVKVLDFGLAKFADALQLTVPGTTIGTVAYMSPEQARGEEADARSDVWALGIVLYEMLTGEPPFKGAYPEALFYAIKNETVPALRRPDGSAPPPALESIVMRTLERDPSRRYQSARELARDLRLLQGRTVPLDLLTGPISQLPPLRAPEPLSWSGRVRRQVTPIRAIVAVVVLAAVAAGTYAWLSRPVVRVPVAIAPVANHTGEPVLDPYRLALTANLVEELSESPNIRVVPYPRLLEIIRRFVGTGDVSSSEAVQAIGRQSGAQFIVVPSLEYRNGMWLAQAQIRSAATATTIKTYEVEPLSSSLPKDAAARLMRSLAESVQAHFKTNGPGRAYKALPASSRFRTLDAERAYEEGLRAYEQGEYPEALEAFNRAASLDDQRSLTYAWIARVMLSLYRGNDAVSASQHAKQLMPAETPVDEAGFIEATLAEARGELTSAEQRYRALVGVWPDGVAARSELAGFLKRHDRNEQSVEAFHELLRLDAQAIGVHVALCQLYTQIGNYPLAEMEGSTALEQYRTSADRAGEAQALLCVGEAQRDQGGARLSDARRNAAQAREIFSTIGLPYNLSRAFQYQGVIEYVDGRLSDAVRFFEEATTQSRVAGNPLIEGLALMNLGVTRGQLGEPAKAIEYLRQSREVFERIGIERRAAEAEVNAAGLQIEYGVEQGDAVRRLATAHVTLEKLGYVDFQLDAMDIEAANLRHEGRLADARRHLLAALSIARDKQLSYEIATITVSLARTDLLLGNYVSARQSLEEWLAKNAQNNLEARIVLGVVYTRLGDFATANKYLRAALVDADQQQGVRLIAAVRLALGEAALESGSAVEARDHFAKASDLWRGNLPDSASVEARSFLGLLGGLTGRDAAAARMIQTSLDEAKRMGRWEIEAQSHLHQARLAFNEKRHDAVMAALNQIPLEGARSISPELKAKALYWRSRAVADRGDLSQAGVDADAARAIVARLRESLTAAEGDRFASREEIRRLFDTADIRKRP